MRAAVVIVAVFFVAVANGATCAPGCARRRPVVAIPLLDRTRFPGALPERHVLQYQTVTARCRRPVVADDIVCEYPAERGDGTLCGFEADSIVDVVRSEGDGSSTFFTLPMCLGHRLALGEHVITFEPIAEWELRRG